MDDEISSDLQKCLTEGVMDTDEGPLINENSNGLSHLLTEGEFNSVDAVGMYSAVGVDESSASNQGFLNSTELSGSVGDYLENNTDGFNAAFDVGDNAVNFPSDTLNSVLSDGDSRLSDAAYKNTASDTDGDCTLKNNMDSNHENDNDVSEVSNNAAEFTSMEQDISELSNDVNPVGTEEAELSNDNNEKTTLARVDQRMSKRFNAEKKLTPVETSNDCTKICEKDHDMVELPEVNENICKNNSSDVGGAEETEVVSEDELPEVQKPSVKDAENVSDDELPGPKPADLPADTEVVSEDELPSSKKDVKESRKRKPDEDKDGYDPGSPTSEQESSNKKQAIVKNGESKPVPAEKRLSVDEKPKKKALPELDKYWKVVNDDPTDFTGWTYLLQYVDQESDVEAAREAYDAFLSHYPYCYGYWRKYADYEKRKGSKKKCLEVLERGLKAIPLSVDLWIHYLNHIKTTRGDDHTYIRAQYERAIEACGLEFRSDRLWESYIKWESENGSALNVTNIYDRLLATPTLGYTSHFDNFQEHVMSEPVTGVVSGEELLRQRGAVRDAAPPAAPRDLLDLPPGEDEPNDHLASEEEGQAIKERVIAARRKIHKTTGEQVAARWTFEERIKRPYFHVKPLERCQLKNWKSYLEWEKHNGTLKRTLVLYERCLIACALYEEFWLRLVRFLEERSETNPELIPVQREVLERACTVHHLDKPELHLHWAQFEEVQGNTAKAAEILDRIEKTCPNLLQIQYRRVNLERRRGDYDKCCQLYETYIAAAKNKAIASALAVKYARFLFHVKIDHAGARKVLDEAITKDPLNQRLYLQRVDLALNTAGTKYEELEELLLCYDRAEGAELEARAQLATRARELCEQLGPAARANVLAARAHALHKQLRKRARKDKHEPAPAASTTGAPGDGKKKEPCSGSGGSAGGASGGGGAAPGSYYAAGAGYDQYAPYQPPWGYQQPQYHPPWPQYPNYY